MNPALWAAKTGLDAQQTRMTVTSNNLANVNTNGFKKGRAVFEDLLYQNVRQVGAATSQDTQLPTGLSLGTGVRVVATEKIYTQGNLRRPATRSTSRSTAAASSRCCCPTARIGYTRDGSFQSQRAGRARDLERLRRAAWHHDSGRRAAVTIGADGVVSVQLAGQSCADAGRHAAALRLRQSRRPAAARREPAARIRGQRSGAGRHARANGLGMLEQGSLESSNVNVVEELVNMIETQRAYEMNSKAIATTDQMLEYVTNQL